MVLSKMIFVGLVSTCSTVSWECRDGTLVRGLTFHCCVLGSIPRPGVTCGLSLLLVLALLRGTFSGLLVSMGY